MTTAYSLKTPSGIQRIIQDALNRADDGELIGFNSTADAQIVLDECWKSLDSLALPSSMIGGSHFFIYRNNLRKLSLKTAIKHDILPTALILRGVQLIDNTHHGSGGFADVYCGTYGEYKVALKRLRVYAQAAPSDKMKLKKGFYRESILWKNLVHDHIVPFLGVAEDVFENGMICMILPWQEKGALRQYLKKLRSEGMNDEQFTLAVDRWLYQTTRGLEYLHDEGIVHGDLHAGNILVDENENACLTDFGMSLLTEATAYNYSSVHGGGALRWSAPELIDPEEFGLKSSRPTPASDVFSFACTAIELYSENIPFPDLTDRMAANRHVRGMRPPRPSLPGGGTIVDAIWSLLEVCWAQNRDDRPPSREVVLRMDTIVRGVPPTTQLEQKMTVVVIQDAEHKASPSHAAPSSAPAPFNFADHVAPRLSFLDDAQATPSQPSAQIFGHSPLSSEASHSRTLYDPPHPPSPFQSHGTHSGDSASHFISHPQLIFDIMSGRAAMPSQAISLHPCLTSNFGIPAVQWVLTDHLPVISQLLLLQPATVPPNNASFGINHPDYAWTIIVRARIQGDYVSVGDVFEFIAEDMQRPILSTKAFKNTRHMAAMGWQGSISVAYANRLKRFAGRCSQGMRRVDFLRDKPVWGGLSLKDGQIELHSTSH